ncbi:MAG: single-stranded DNA-binding protein [Planctomycetota bacterium]|nr:single-stranded DNA-binding protein [Planctomycetota bacterium]
MNFTSLTDDLVRALAGLRFAEPITHVYNPLEYARSAWDEYTRRFGASPREILWLGMNPGPWGMAQTGVPFGEVALVRDWMGINTPVDKPRVEHPKRPIEGFSCARSEVSGRRLWGWAKNRFNKPEAFFKRFFVANYCPLVFMEASGRNFTPDKLPAREKERLFEACDAALEATIELLKPKLAFGVGGFAFARLEAVCAGRDVKLGQLLHPSPANPKANKDWEGTIERQLAEAGVVL